MFVNAVTADDTLRGNTCECETAASATDGVKTINLSSPLLSLDIDLAWDWDKEFFNQIESEQSRDYSRDGTLRANTCERDGTDMDIAIGKASICLPVAVAWPEKRFFGEVQKKTI